MLEVAVRIFSSWFCCHQKPFRSNSFWRGATLIFMASHMPKILQSTAHLGPLDLSTLGAQASALPALVPAFGAEVPVSGTWGQAFPQEEKHVNNDYLNLSRKRSSRCDLDNLGTCFTWCSAWNLMVDFRVDFHPKILFALFQSLAALTRSRNQSQIRVFPQEKEQDKKSILRSVLLGRQIHHTIGDSHQKHSPIFHSTQMSALNNTSGMQLFCSQFEASSSQCSFVTYGWSSFAYS